MAETVAVVSSVFGCLTVGVTLVSPCLREPLSEEYNFYRKRKEAHETLKSKMNKLEQRLSEVERQCKEKVVSKSFKVLEWLKMAEKFMKDMNESNFEDRILKMNCFGLPKYRTQYKAGKKIAERIIQLDALLKDGKEFVDVGESNVVGQKKGAVELVSEAASKLEEIMMYVRGNEVGTILIYGMAGSGKTQVVSVVNNLILDEYKSLTAEGINSTSRKCTKHQYFDKVIWVTAENNIGSNQSSSIDSLQKKIAEKLQVDLNKATGSRAETLESALTELRFLIILDDMWKKISLEAIGIPRPTKENCCKVIIVSRSVPVCSDIKFDKRVEIKPLSGSEAQNLFEREAGITLSALTVDTRAIAMHMVDECDGLPLAIVSLAQTLTELKTDDSVNDTFWNEAFDGLKGSTVRLEGMKEKALARLKQGYDMLKEEAQQCFLYCALYPCGHKIEKKRVSGVLVLGGFIGSKRESCTYRRYNKSKRDTR